MAQQKIAVTRNQKDSVFRMLFREKKELLSIYNALNDTDYDDPEELEVCTLENAVYMSHKNDVSFLLDSELNLYEHQASVNPNMPLRDLIYIARQLEKFLLDRSVYSSRLVKIPLPRFVVFYNGDRPWKEDGVLKLSDAFLKAVGDPELELKVRVININQGHNREFLEKCRTLKEYAAYVKRVREHSRRLPPEEAVPLAVDECIAEGILSEFLRKQKAEVIAMSIFEYDEELEMKKLRREEYNFGVEDGRAKGRAVGGQEKLISQICKKLRKEKTPEQIADELEEELSSISPILEAAAAYAPEYDETAVIAAILPPETTSDNEDETL